ncbi:MAG: hypothetical protein AB1513_02885 [Pseudomonadota bacterium]
MSRRKALVFLGVSFLFACAVFAAYWAGQNTPKTTQKNILPGSAVQGCTAIIPSNAIITKPYTGNCKQNLAHGQGEIGLQLVSDTNKKTYSILFKGTFRNGYLDGDGTEQGFDGEAYSWYEGTFNKWQRWNGTLWSGESYASATENAVYANGETNAVEPPQTASTPTPQGEIAEMLAEEQKAPVMTDETTAAQSSTSESKPSILDMLGKMFVASLEEQTKTAVLQEIDKKLARIGIAPQSDKPPVVKIISLGIDGITVSRKDTSQNVCLVDNMNLGSLAQSMGLRNGDVIFSFLSQDLSNGCGEIDAIAKSWGGSNGVNKLVVWSVQQKSYREVPFYSHQIRAAQQRIASLH